MLANRQTISKSRSLTTITSVWHKNDSINRLDMLMAPLWNSRRSNQRCLCLEAYWSRNAGWNISREDRKMARSDFWLELCLELQQEDCLAVAALWRRQNNNRIEFCLFTNMVWRALRNCPGIKFDKEKKLLTIAQIKNSYSCAARPDLQSRI